MQNILITKFHVENAYEAQELATKLKNDGVYDVFRGQRRCWPLNSTLSRLNSSKSAKEAYQLNYFASWINNTSDLPDLKDQPDKILSVAQHYGIPTTLIDFTYNPEVALFFATDHADFISEGCIYCASKEKLKIEFDLFNTNLQRTIFRILELEVGNLWRLQSQQGLFIDAPISNWPYWEDFFSFHKIIFPQKRLIKSKISRNLIYPDRKSRLEIRLDQYFRGEEVQEGLKRAIEAGIELHSIPWESDYKIFLNDKTPIPGPDWSNNEIAKWDSVEFELFDGTINREILRIEIPQKNSKITFVQSTFKQALFSYLKEDSLAKNKIIKFQVIPKEHDIEWPDTLSMALEVYWDGIKSLAYSDDEISEGIGNLGAMLFASILHKEKYIDKLFGETYEFECKVRNGGYFRAPLPKSMIIEALDSELLPKIDLTLYPKVKSIFNILYHVHNVKVLFRFKEFRKLMCEFIVPCQIIANVDPTNYYSNSDKHPWIVFSPFDITDMRSALSFLTYSSRYRHENKIIALHPNLQNQELIILMANSLLQIEKGHKPSTVTISGYTDDSRELYEIPEVIQFCKRLVEIGFISILEVSTQFRDMPETYDPFAYGAFEVWSIANEKMKKSSFSDEVKLSFEQFYPELLISNSVCDDEIKNVARPIDEEELARIKMKGLFGSD